jgi:cytochrome oxidase assembly protein ShyY1
MRDATVVRFALRPRWWAWHAALVVVLVAFGWLGWWQLQSFDDSATSDSSGRPVVALDRVTAPGGRLATDDVGRRVRATGGWEPDAQLVVPARARDGRRGALVVTPLRTASGLLPVVRGWVPEGAAAPRPPDGRVDLVGVLQPSETEADARVGAVDLPAGQVAYVATVTLLERLPYGADELYDGYVVLRSQQPPDPQGPQQVEPTVQAGQGGVGELHGWRNLAYGLQWWLFAGAAVFFWAAVIRRAAREQAAPAPEPDEARGPLSAPRRTT